MSGRELRPGVLPKQERRGKTDRHLLALTGGGYRGLFTATLIEQIEQPKTRFADQFDMVAGTSIGGILAIGLACGVSGATLAALIRDRGAEIFRPRLTSFGGFTSSRYSNSGLRKAVVAAIGQKFASRSFCDIPVPLIICAVDEVTSQPRIFRTNSAAGGQGDQVSTLDVALATSAAPTYFPPHPIDGRNHVDGGLIANAPDVILLTEAMRRFGCGLDECHLLSLGTAGSPRRGKVKGTPGKLGWIARHALVELIMTAQEELAMLQVDGLGPSTFLRVDQRPADPISLDDVSEMTKNYLIGLANDTVSVIKRNKNEILRRFMSHRGSR